MGDVIRRMVWFFVVASFVAYATFLVAGSIVNAQTSGIVEPSIIRDELGPGVHRLIGMVMVPSSCDQLSVHTDKIAAFAFNLSFSTWRDPVVACSKEEVPRPFHAVLFAPAAGVDFVATLDGKNLPIEVIPVVPDSKP